MAVKTKWVRIDVDKLDSIFTLLDKINTAAVRGLIDKDGKELLLDQLRQEIPFTIIQQEEPAEPAPREEPAQQQAKTETTDKQSEGT